MVHNKWLQTGLSRRLKQNRFDHMNRLAGGQLTNPSKKIRILDVGCAQGKDVLSFIPNHPNIELYGLDIKKYEMMNKHVNFIIGDAANMDFPDNYFDITLSLGMLEHIQPMEKMCDVIKEIDRVSKEFFVLIPSMTTPFEPHTHQFFWPLRRRRKHHPWLLFMDDLTWLKFQGFSQAYVHKFWYIPGLISNLVIYKNKDSISIRKKELKLWEPFKY